MTRRTLPPEAYAPNGELWWDLEFSPGTKRLFGGEQKLAAWLYSTFEVGDLFTMKDARLALGSTDEQLGRRLRRLREDGWTINSNQDDRDLGISEYRVLVTGWHPAAGARPHVNRVSTGMRTQVFERDGYTCTMCGLRAGEQYPDSGSKVSLTIGHRHAHEKGGSTEINNLRTECTWCNEPKRNLGRTPESFDDVFNDIRTFKTVELRSIATWLVAGEKERSKVDRAYDRARMLGAEDRDLLVDRLRTIIGSK